MNLWRKLFQRGTHWAPVRTPAMTKVDHVLLEALKRVVAKIGHSPSRDELAEGIQALGEAIRPMSPSTVLEAASSLQDRHQFPEPVWLYEVLIKSIPYIAEEVRPHRRPTGSPTSLGPESDLPGQPSDFGRFWQCPDCGGILEKNEATLLTVRKMRGVAGRASCSFCGHAEEASRVYNGAFDFVQSDEFIQRMGTDQENLAFDESSKRWYYKKEVVALRADQKEVTAEEVADPHDDRPRIFYLGPGSPSDDRT